MITLYTHVDAGRPINKRVKRNPDGGIIKGMAKHRQHYIAETRDVPDAAAMAALLHEIGERPDQMISLATFIDPPASTWHTWTATRMARFLGCSKEDRVRLSGWHDVGSGVPTAVRLKENLLASTWLLFDRDVVENMPPELAALDYDDWCAAVDLLFPGFAEAGKVMLPSTSTRVLIDGVPLSSRSSHTFVRVNDVENIPAAWSYAYERSAVTSWGRSWDEPTLLGFAKPRRSHATGDICGRQLWTIYDQSTWALNRLVFDGCPVVEGAGLSVIPPEMRVVDGPSLDLSAVKPPSQRELKEIREATRTITGNDVSPKRSYGTSRTGNRVITGTVYIIPILRMDQQVELEDGQTTTVEALHSAGEVHVRLQSPFRDSRTMNAFYGVHHDGTPFIFDNGTRERYVLDRDQLKKRMWEMIIDWVHTDYQLEIAYHNNMIYSAKLEKKITFRDVFADPDIVDRLALASDAPCDAKGRVKILSLGTEFRKNLENVVWGRLLRTLPREDSGDAVDFKACVGALLKHMVFGEGTVCATWPGKRALGTWLHYIASRPGYQGIWMRFGSYDAKSFIDKDGMRVAILYTLAGQLSKTSHPEINAMSNPGQLTRRCKQSGICDRRSNIIVEDGVSERWTILSTDFIASLDIAMDHYEMSDATDEQKAEFTEGLGKGYFSRGNLN